MSDQISLTKHHPSPLRVWTRLAAEHRLQVIRLMAQLAFKLVLAQPNSPLKEVTHALATEYTQNPD